MKLTAKAQKVLKVLIWRMSIEEPEFISAPNYRKDYMGFESISQKDLTLICTAVNRFFSTLDSSLRVTNVMGEIRPYEQKQWELV
jgi:hypothetical protein